MAEPTYKKVDSYYYDPAKPLGKGAFATVYKATDERTGEEVAVKVISAAKLLESEDQYNLFMREINVLREIKGQHIVRLLDVKRTTNNLYIFTDFCNGGDLEKKLKAKHPFTEEESLTILKQIADAFITIDSLQIVNSKGHKVIIMHRDIKAANILFHEGRIKVADFGFAKLIDEVDKNARKAHTLLGTPLYMAPQILNDENYSTKCDIWSTGVLFYEILFGKLPWTGTSVPNLYSNIKSKALTYPKNISSETKDLIAKMLEIKEDKRLSWKELYEHPALKKINIKPDVKNPVDPQNNPTNQQSQQYKQTAPQPQPQPQPQTQTQPQQVNPPTTQQQQQQQGQSQQGGYPQQQYPQQQAGYPQQQYPQQYPQQGGYPQQQYAGYPQQGYPQQQQQQQGFSQQKPGGYPQQQQGGYPQPVYNQGYQQYPQQQGYQHSYQQYLPQNNFNPQNQNPGYPQMQNQNYYQGGGQYPGQGKK